MTFRDIWRKVRLYVPDAPVFLVRTWVQDAFATLSDKRGWVWSVGEGQITWADARLGLTIGVTRGSTAITSAALFTGADAGRQFRVGSFPIYTIQSVSGASDAVLDLPYQAGPTGSVTADILDVYATMPEDFGRFVVVTDPVNQRFVPWWATQEELRLVDPVFMATAAVPRVLVGSKPSTYAPTVGRLQYQLWPIPTAAGMLNYFSIQRPPALVDDYSFAGVLAHRTDVLESGALAAAAKWPGTRDRPNPYFNLALARTLTADFEQGCLQLDLRDDDQIQQSISLIPWDRWNGWLWAFDTHLLQMTDATLGSYAGYGATWPAWT